MKKSAFILFLIALCGCNFSDESIELPGGHTYIDEGRCYKFILVNIKNGKNIESCVSEYRFNDNFITACQINPKACEIDSIKMKDKLFYIIDVKNEIVFGPLSKPVFLKKLTDLKAEKKLFID